MAKRKRRKKIFQDQLLKDSESMGKAKIIAMRDSLHPLSGRFVCIDGGVPSAYMCAFRILKENDFKVLQFNLLKLSSDIIEIPSMEMYLNLGELLREKGYVFNKKKGELIDKRMG